MDIMGQHYVVSRMDELLDVMPPMNLRLAEGSPTEADGARSE